MIEAPESGDRHEEVVAAFVDRARQGWRPAPRDPAAFRDALAQRRARRRRRRSVVGSLAAALVAGGLWLMQPSEPTPTAPVVTANEPVLADAPPDAPTGDERTDRIERLAVLEPWVAAAVPASRGLPPMEATGALASVYGDIVEDHPARAWPGATGGDAMGQAPPPPPRPLHHPPSPVEVLLERGDEFGLAGEDIARMVEIAEAARDGRAPLRQAVDEARADLEAALREVAPADAAIDEALRALGDAEYALRRYDLDVMLEMRAVLGAEDLAAFEAMFPGPPLPPRPPARPAPR